LNSIEEILKRIIEAKNRRIMENLNETLLLQYRLMSLQPLTTLTDNEHDVILWHDQLASWLRIQKIEDPKETYDWCTMKVQGLGAKAISEAVITDDQANKTYPSLEEMKEILLKTYKLKKNPEDIINELKSMKINKNDDVKEFDDKSLCATYNTTIAVYSLNEDQTYSEKYKITANLIKYYGFVQINQNQLCVSTELEGKKFLSFYLQFK